jgi:hypothetical protein
MDWAALFDEMLPEPGASDQQIAALTHGLKQPLSQVERDAVTLNHIPVAHRTVPLPPVQLPFDIDLWVMPKRKLPQSFLAFLRWSNGGYFRNGTRQFANIFSTVEIREMMLAYEFPQYMPQAVPFAFDGGGCFYSFDLRNEPLHDEYPIVFCGAGSLDYDEATLVATTFVAACSGRVDPRDQGEGAT